METNYKYKGMTFNKGIQYQWDKRHSNNDTNLKGKTWLQEQIDKENEYHEKENTELILPVTKDQSSYDLDKLTDEQSHIAYKVLEKILEWINFAGQGDSKTIFSPLRMTVAGKAGNGKSYLIQTLVTAIRLLTGINDSITVCAPTGAAAYNINGKTLHSQFGLNIFDLSTDISKKRKHQLVKSMKRCIVFICDERSMLSCEVLAACERNIRECIFGGVCQRKEFGGMPVVLLIGDDSQLPPVIRNGCGKGAFYLFDDNKKISYNAKQNVSQEQGIELFKKLTQTVMELTIRKRQHGDNYMINLLDDLETGSPSENTISSLMSLHLSQVPHNIKQAIQSKAIYMFATHEDKNDHNCEKLSNICNIDNPLACLKYKNHYPSKRCFQSHFDSDSTPLNTYFCVGAIVAIKGKNFQPCWGLYNGAIGTVKEIVFENQCNPNLGDLPAYVSVEFESYNPPTNVPPFDPSNKKVNHFFNNYFFLLYLYTSNTNMIFFHIILQIVPIPIVQQTCRNYCCTIDFCPLVLSFSRTIHSFQGQEVGPNKPVQTIIVNPGKRGFEALNPGTLYCCVTRATTLGDLNKYNSAIYFTGSHMCRDRIKNLIFDAKGNTYKKVQMRERWITYLKNIIAQNIYNSKEEYLKLIEIVNNTKLTVDKLDKIIQYHNNL